MVDVTGRKIVRPFMYQRERNGHKQFRLHGTLAWLDEAVTMLCYGKHFRKRYNVRPVEAIIPVPATLVEA